MVQVANESNISNEKNGAQSFFEFVHYAVSPKTQSIPDIMGMDWCHLFKFAYEHTIIGVCFEGISRLYEQGFCLPLEMLMEWIAAAGQIEGLNKALNKKCVEVVNEYRAASFDCCVLKGQGNTLMYPNPYARSAGDIDLLIKNADRQKLMQYVKEKKQWTGFRFHHVEYEEDGISVELHFIPSVMNNPIYHRRLQKWFTEKADKDNIWTHFVDLPDGVGTIPVPTVEYNLIYQLSHLMHHFFDEGIGLRQIVDYYYLLHKVERSELKNESYRETLRYLNLYKFAGAVMYVMREVFHLEEEYLITPVDERRGKMLLNEILKGGNFGHYSGLTRHSMGMKYFQKIKRNMGFVCAYPSEALCEPIFRTWHFFWRRKHD